MDIIYLTGPLFGTAAVHFVDFLCGSGCGWPVWCAYELLWDFSRSLLIRISTCAGYIHKFSSGFGVPDE